MNNIPPKPSTTALLAILLTLAAAPSCYMFRSSDTFYGLKTAGQRVVFVVDTSGSMEGKNEGSLQDQVTGAAVHAGGKTMGNFIGGSLGSFVGKQTASEATKLGGAKRELIPAIQGLPPGSSFAIVTFGRDVKPWILGMAEVNTQNQNVATALIKQLEASGSTPARKALEAAFAFQDATLVVFVSDGRPTDGNAREILTRVQTLNSGRHLVVSTVGLGDDQDEGFLTALATENGGQYIKR
jgi:von Willebrand factor type A domain